jgi:ribosome-associated protein
MLVVNEEIQVPLRELNFSFARSSGPGGQNVNKLNTKATLRWDVQATSCLPEDVKQRFFAQYRRRITKEGQLVLASQRFRDQGRNVADCLEKLRQLILTVALRPKLRKPTKPTKASRTRRLNDKQANARRKQLRRPPRGED